MKSFRPKDGSGEPPASGRNGERDFHGEKRSNETHASTTDPDARLYRNRSESARLVVIRPAACLLNGMSIHSGRVGRRRRAHIRIEIMDAFVPMGGTQ